MSASPISSTPGMASPASSSNGGMVPAAAAASLLAAGGDQAIKYHKLANEYAKLRAQFGVVKKAVVEEQGKSADLAEALRLKEVKERKSEAEMDSLNFRNQQLTKRIQFLQEEMEALESSSATAAGKRKGSTAARKSETAAAIQSSESLNSVIGQELQAKIEENARLHARLSDIDQRYEELVGSLQSRIRELESESKRKAQAERADDAKQKDLIQGLKAENVELLHQIQQLERNLVDHKDRVTVLTLQLETSTPPSEEQSSRAQQQQQTKTHFFPLTANDARIQSVELLSQFGECVTDLVASLSDFHTYWEHRLKDTNHDGPLSDIAARLSRLLLQNVRHLKPVEEAFQSVLSRVLSKGEDDPTPALSFFGEFASSFRKYAEYVCEVESLAVACLQQESNHYSCPPTQQTRNGQLQTSLRAFNRVLVRLADHLGRLMQAKEEEEAVEDINVALSQLCQQVKELSGIYSAKAADENQLPTVTDQLKNTNHCIEAALAGMTTSVAGLSRQLSDSLPRIITLIRAGRRTMQSAPAPPVPVVDSEMDKTAEIIRRDEEDDSSRRLAEALKEQKHQMDLLVAELTEKVRKVEQIREHWKLECQLLEMKYDRLRKTQTGSESGGGCDTDQDKLFAEREEVLKKPFIQRIDELVSERLNADSKAVTFHLECIALSKRWKAAEARMRRLEDELRESKGRVELLREEMGTTAANYEGQLGMMTEHVANMNDKLTSQTDQIESLKYELGRKK